MYAGKIMEKAHVEELFSHPRHPYTRGLLASIPKIGNKTHHLPTIAGMVPAIDQRPAGCYFADRCERALDVCFLEAATLQPLREIRHLACWNPYED